jgi:hypothetical protein
MRFEISEDNFIKHPIINVFFVDNVNETDKSAALKRTGCNSIGCSEPPSYPDKHAALSRKSTDWLARNQDNVSEWNDKSICGLLFQ